LSSSGAAELDAPLLLNRYQPNKLLARGASALVFQGWDTVLGRNVAIKLFRTYTAESMDAFRDEVRVLAALNHHGVVAINDMGLDRSSADEPRPFLVMEFVRGMSLRELLGERRPTTTEIGELGFEIAEALEYVHAQGVIHRDITPSNIMLVDYGTTLSRTRARLTDFGIAIAVGTEHEHGQPTEGTPAYLSPEQASGWSLTPASDIYSLGLVLLECFTGKRAFPGNGDAVSSALARLSSDPEIPEIVPVRWAELLRRMTSRDPADRPAAAELATDIRRTLRDSGRHTDTRTADTAR
jgi:eukaryotic-like serine/threonine-protein kinase